ncbi:MAG TPA: VOC family protein [Candidatus Babeliales bacterium]|nr:VOC family protein [Candidatus Babeliales bacterium]
MITKISHFALLVRNQDEAAAFYTEKLGFVVTEGHKSPDGNFWYWLTLAPSKDSTVSLSLLAPQEPEDHGLIGKQSGSIPLFVLLTDDCHKTIETFKNNGVTIIKEPTNEFWGIDAVIKDLYGNLIDVCQPTEEKNA